MRTRALVLCIPLVVAACGEVAITGRPQLLLISDTQMAELARQSRGRFIQQADREGRIVKATDSDQTAKRVPSVNTVAARIVQAAGVAQRAQWRVFVVRSSQVNANASADGTIVVYTGILPVAKHEVGLAAILGHEVAHVIARHSAERVSQNLLAKGVTNLAVAC